MPVAERTDPEPFVGLAALPIGLNLVGLGLLVWGVVAEIDARSSADHLAPLLLLGFAVAGWLGWVSSRERQVRGLAAGSLAVMCSAGGALAVFAPLGVIFVGVAALGASLAWPIGFAMWFVAAGPLAVLVRGSGGGPRPGYRARRDRCLPRRGGHGREPAPGAGTLEERRPGRGQ